MTKYSKLLFILYLTVFLLSPSALPAKTTEISAIISDDVGCSMTIPSVLNFTPQRTVDFKNTLKTHEIKQLRAIFSCEDKTGKLIPKITLQGNTPYNTDTVFLDGVLNGAGFMLRIYDGSMPSLDNFYNTEKAIARGKKIQLTPLNSENNFQTEEIFLVGLVGPVDSTVIPGEFSASLIFNLIFQ